MTNVLEKVNLRVSYFWKIHETSLRAQ